mmetsp:Transcript_5687/g.13826  ORF Transcript_5687/g.13826 Transcript_5687/m.13826 type:complete len:247 (-) Transcript_5687:341-1081(-)
MARLLPVTLSPLTRSSRCLRFHPRWTRGTWSSGRRRRARRSRQGTSSRPLRRIRPPWNGRARTTGSSPRSSCRRGPRTSKWALRSLLWSRIRRTSPRLRGTPGRTPRRRPPRRRPPRRRPRHRSLGRRPSPRTRQEAARQAGRASSRARTPGPSRPVTTSASRASLAPARAAGSSRRTWRSSLPQAGPSPRPRQSRQLLRLRPLEACRLSRTSLSARSRRSRRKGSRSRSRPSPTSTYRSTAGSMS